MVLLAAAPLLAVLAAAPAPTPGAAAPAASGLELAGAPFVRYSPETAWGFGAFGLGWFSADEVTRRAGRASWVGGALQYTTREQAVAALQWDLYLAESTWRTDGALLGERWPYEWWGAGASTTSRSEPFTARTLRLDAGLSRLVRPAGPPGQGLWLGARAGVRGDEVGAFEPGGAIGGCLVEACRGGRWAGLQATVSWDTRDHVFAAWSGLWLTARAGASRPLGGDGPGWRQLDLDLRGYRTAAPLPGQVSAQLRLSAAAGDVPFHLLPTFGGDRSLRGVLEGRWRDGAAVSAQAEWAFPVAGRLGAALFGGAGTTGPRPGALSAGRLTGAGGAGLRWVLDAGDRVSLRLDYGLTRGASQWYLAIGQSL
jgi:hypothetical protein